MRYVIRAALSHSHIKEQITTVGSHGCIIIYRVLANLHCIKECIADTLSTRNSTVNSSVYGSFFTEKLVHFRGKRQGTFKYLRRRESFKSVILHLKYSLLQTKVDLLYTCFYVV